VPAEVVESVPDALERALEQVGADDLVLVTGSLYVVGAARSAARRLGCMRS
jgi:folylpolyglutamate synthase/dihydropteroate synthase